MMLRIRKDVCIYYFILQMLVLFLLLLSSRDERMEGNRLYSYVLGKTRNARESGGIISECFIFSFVLKARSRDWKESWYPRIFSTLEEKREFLTFAVSDRCTREEEEEAKKWEKLANEAKSKQKADSRNSFKYTIFHLFPRNPKIHLSWYFSHILTNLKSLRIPQYCPIKQQSQIFRYTTSFRQVPKNQSIKIMKQSKAELMQAL